MSIPFLFWLSALYTVALFGVQAAEFATAGRVSISVSTANAFYLALLSAYVGSKEVQRWAIGFQPDPQTDEGQTPPRTFRPRGEWFVGLWAVFLLIAVLGSELWPAKLAYPNGLTLIAFEVLGFYIGSSASRWLSERQEQQAHREVEQQLEAESMEDNAPAKRDKPAPKRLTRKRERYEQHVLRHARSNGGLTREQTEKLLRLSRAAANRLLSGMVQRGQLVRPGDPNSPSASYQAA